MPKERKFRPLPSDLRAMRYGARYDVYARVYALYETTTGKRKRASFQVYKNPRMSNKTFGQAIRVVIRNILDKRIPVHKQGEVFSSFNELLRRTKWVRVRKILRYKAGAIYER